MDKLYENEWKIREKFNQDQGIRALRQKQKKFSADNFANYFMLKWLPNINFHDANEELVKYGLSEDEQIRVKAKIMDILEQMHLKADNIKE